MSYSESFLFPVRRQQITAPANHAQRLTWIELALTGQAIVHGRVSGISALVDVILDGLIAPGGLLHD